jgi:hypothetical protein
MNIEDILAVGSKSMVILPSPLFRIVNHLHVRDFGTKRLGGCRAFRIRIICYLRRCFPVFFTMLLRNFTITTTEKYVLLVLFILLFCILPVIKPQKVFMHSFIFIHLSLLAGNQSFSLGRSLRLEIHKHLQLLLSLLSQLLLTILINCHLLRRNAQLLHPVVRYIASY